MRTNLLTSLSRAIGVFVLVILGVLRAGNADAQTYDAWVLTNNSLVLIDTANPSAGNAPVMITGLIAGDTLVGIDFRPINGYLYGLGFNSIAGTVQLYNVSFRTGVATPIGASGTFVAADGTTPVPIAGTGLGLDFNPVVDRLRVVNDAGQNFRINPNTGAFVDGDLGGAAGSVTGLNMDGAINGAATAVDGAAYTNNLIGSPSTTLYTLSAGTNTLHIQNPPNGGTATLPVVVTLNGSALDFTVANGFDIPPDALFSLTENGPSGGDGLAALTVGGTTSLYTVNLTSGIASLVGPIGAGAIPIQGFAIHAVRNPTQCGAQGIVLHPSNQLQSMNTICGGSGSGALIAVTGLVAAETLVAIDFRAQTGQLYGLGFNAANGSGSATLYRLDPSTGAATIIGVAGGVANGAGSPISLAGAISFGFDFNPTVDRIRVVTSNGLNFRLNPNDGTVVGGALDSPINGMPAGSMGLVGAAYTNSFGQSLIGGVTTLYTLDPTSDRLFIQNPANSGTQTAGVPVTENGSPLDFDNVAGFDIAPAIRVTTSNAPAVGMAYAVLGVGPVPIFGGTAPRRYMIDLASGVAHRLTDYWVGQVWTGLAFGDSARDHTSTALTSSAPTATAGQPVTFTATLLLQALPGVSVSPTNATGTVAFSIAGSPISGCSAQPVSGVTATCTTSFGLPGSVQVVATYGGDGIHRGSASTALNQTITMAPSTTVLTATPNLAQVGAPVSFVATVTPAGATGTVTFRLNGDILGTVAVPGSGATVATTNLPEGTHQIQASYSGDASRTPSHSSPVTVRVAAAGPLTQHFAEGATGFMQTDIGVFNTSVLSPALVNVTLFPEAGNPVELPFALNPLERQSIDLNAVTRALLVPDQGFSILVESTQPVAATRQMAWGNPVYGSTLESGIPSTSPTWYFAEGATNIFSLFYMVENPNAVPATVVLTHLLEGGAAPVSQSAVVPPFARRTFYINDVPGLASAALSTIVASDLPVVAERAMYLNTTSRLWEGGAAGRGATALSTSWSFAEGATGFFHTYLLLGNPSDATATVTVHYQLPSGATLTKSYSVAARSRRTIDVNREDVQLASTSVGMTVTSTLPIVAERAMWWGGNLWTEGSVSVGSSATGTVWAIGEGAEGGSGGESTFVQISNATANQGALRFTVVYDDGAREQREYTLLGNARLTVRIADDFANAAGRKFSVLVESLTGGVPITTEYARYQSTTTFGDGGGAALATRIR
jgi:hypothetical protein